MTLLQRRYAPRKRASLPIFGTDSFPQDEAINAPDLIWQRLLDGESPLRVWREFRRLSREALAARLDVTPLLICAYERESVPITDALRARISTILGIPAAALVRMVDKRVITRER